MLEKAVPVFVATTIPAPAPLPLVSLVGMDIAEVVVVATAVDAKDGRITSEMYVSRRRNAFSNGYLELCDVYKEVDSDACSGACE